MQCSLHIQPAQIHDFLLWKPLWQSYQDFYQVNLSDTVTKTTWQRFFDVKEPLYCALAKEGEQIVGFVHYVIHRSTWAVENFCYLEDLYVSPESRGQHTGKQLIEHVQKHAQTQQCARLYWHTQETNQRAQRLYDWVAEKPGVIEYRMPLM